MTVDAADLASVFPGNVALNAFNKVVLYQQHQSIANSDIGILIIWMVLFFIATIMIKKIRNV